MVSEYKEIRLLGEGGFGQVFLVKKGDKEYALKKILIKDLQKKEIEIKKYQEEINILKIFNHQYIVKLYDNYIDNEYMNIIMEYGGDKNLKMFINEYKDKNLLIEENIIEKIIKQICLGLKEIYKVKIIHRDLTPDNIFINENNDIKIGDFGVSKILNSKKYTTTQVGKYKYFAPEIIKGQKYDYRVDIYALGCIIYELFTLREYQTDKLLDEVINIDIDVYSKKWQLLIDLLLQKDYHYRPDINKIIEIIKREDNKNEIKCIYNKQDDEIELLYDYNKNKFIETEESYIEAKNNINEKNIEIFINNKKIQFDFRYKSNEKGKIQVNFRFNTILTNTRRMFKNCQSLESIDLSSFNTNNVTNMSSMFNECSSLRSIDLFSFNTNNVTNMEYMFFKCSSLESIDLSSFNINNVTNMYEMFAGCTSLKSLDLSSFNQNKVTSTKRMFCGCLSLESINFTSFNTNNVTNMCGMFHMCPSLKSLDLASFNTNNVTNMNAMFRKCTSLKSIDLSSFNTNKVTQMNCMFMECSSLESIDLSSFNTNNVESMNNMFYGCSSLKENFIKINSSDSKILKIFKKKDIFEFDESILCNLFMEEMLDN